METLQQLLALGINGRALLVLQALEANMCQLMSCSTCQKLF